jgi:phosphatidyl-myo-inositol alpha-mannosyltransferase
VRIGIVAEYVRPWPGGISEHVHHEALELARRGHTPIVVTGPAEVAWRDDTPGARVIRLPWALHFTSNGSRSRMVIGPQLLGLRRLFRRLGLDVVHVHAPLDPLLGLMAVLASPVATVGTFHASFRPMPLWDLLYGALRPVTGRAVGRLDARIAVSEEARISIAHYFPVPFTRIPNGVDVERFGPSVPPLRDLCDSDRPTILFVGRLDRRKGLPVLLAAMSRVRRRLPAVRLVIAGTGETAALRMHLDALDPATRAAVHLAGYVQPDLLPCYFAACDVFCSPATQHESQGVVLLEAMASGRCVVAFDIPGYREVVTSGRQGWLVPRIDAESLADALVDALTDPVQTLRMGDAGRQTAVEHYAWSAVAERLEMVFESVRRSHR